jgi:tetratricopeptide (TPR) repeat protein
MLYLAGVAEFRRGENSSAITELRSALAIQPSDQLAAFQAGLATQASGDYDSALPYWRAAEAANYFSRLGARSLAAGNLAGANLLYQTAAEIEPNRATLSDLGLVLSARGQWVSAAQAFARASEVDPTAPEPLIRQAAILQDELGQADVAVPILERAVELAPNYSIWPYIRLGNYYRVLGDASSALAWYERAHSAFPNDPEPLAQISDLRSR